MAITPEEIEQIAQEFAAGFSALQQIDSFVTAAVAAPPPTPAPAPALEPLMGNIKNFLSMLHGTAAKIQAKTAAAAPPNPPLASPPA
jgi:hypothetical protein